MQICAILFPGFALSSLCLARDCLAQANLCAGRSLLSLHSRAATPGPVVAADGTPVMPDVTGWQGGAGLDLVLLLAGDAPYDSLGMGLRGFLARADAGGATLGGLGRGGLILARLGLLRGHCAALPAPHPAPDDVALSACGHVLDRRRLTAGFGLSPVAALLDWIARDVDLPLATRTASALHLDILNRDGSGPDTGPACADPVLRRMLTVMQANLTHPAPLDRIATALDLSPKQLRLRCHKGLGAPPAQVYLRLRLDRARHLVMHSAQGVEAIAHATGFAAPSSFTRAFRQAFGHSPRALRGGAQGFSPSRSGA